MSSPEIAYQPPRFRFRLPDWNHLRERLASRIVKFGLGLVPDDNLLRHAKDELRIAGMFDVDADYGGMMGTAVMDMMKVFSLEGHSGFSAGMATSIFERVSRYEPLTPLTGADDEWMEVGDGWFQNRRCGRVFKRDGQAYDNEARVFREPNGVCFTSFESRVPVTFPYVPKREYVDRPASDDDGLDV